MLIGYARVSTQAQNLDRQLASLNAAGCTRIFAEKASGKSLQNRPELERAITALPTGGTLVIAEWDRAPLDAGRHRHHDPCHQMGALVKGARTRLTSTLTTTSRPRHPCAAVRPSRRRTPPHRRPCRRTAASPRLRANPSGAAPPSMPSNAGPPSMRSPTENPPAALPAVTAWLSLTILAGLDPPSITERHKGDLQIAQ